MTASVGVFFIYIFDKEYESEYKPRYESIKSISNVKNAFEGLQFNVRIYENLDNKLFRSKLRGLINREECESHDSFVLYISFHGFKDGFLASNNIKIKFDYVFTMLSNQNCKKFINKPKIIFFDCCRGDI